MSIETSGHGSELVTACHGFRQPYDFLVRLKGGDILSPPFVEQRGEATCPPPLADSVIRKFRTTAEVAKTIADLRGKKK